jgi:hypothetical protein
MLKLSLRVIAWFFSAWVIGWYVFSVEAALFAPPQLYVLTDILMPVRMAVVAWTALSVLLVLESAMKRPIQSHELLIRAVSFLLSVSFTYTLVFTELGGGAYWSLGTLSVAPRVLIGLVFGLGWLYVAASPWIERDKWFKVGEVAIDTGTLLMTDPARIDGELPPLDELGGLKESDRLVSTTPIEGLKKPKGWTYEMASHACQVLFKEGHEGAGVTVKTGAGDGQYFVYAKFGRIKGLPGGYRILAKSERFSAVKVEFTPWRPNREPPPAVGKKR